MRKWFSRVGQWILKQAETTWRKLYDGRYDWCGPPKAQKKSGNKR